MLHQPLAVILYYLAANHFCCFQLNLFLEERIGACSEQRQKDKSKHYRSPGRSAASQLNIRVLEANHHSQW